MSIHCQAHEKPDDGELSNEKELCDTVTDNQLAGTPIPHDPRRAMYERIARGNALTQAEQLAARRWKRH